MLCSDPLLFFFFFLLCKNCRYGFQSMLLVPEMYLVVSDCCDFWGHLKSYWFLYRMFGKYLESLSQTSHHWYMFITEESVFFDGWSFFKFANLTNRNQPFKIHPKPLLCEIFTPPELINGRRSWVLSVCWIPNHYPYYERRKPKEGKKRKTETKH